MISEKVNQIDVKCACGCSTLEITQWYEKDKAQEVWISNKMRSINAYYHPGFYRFLERIKLIWAIIRGKEYYFYELDLNKKQQIVDFKNAVAKLDENIEEYNRGF
jgi:hypothetical protein